MMPLLSRPSRYPCSHLFLCSKSPAALRPPALIKKQTEPLSRPAGVLLRMVRDSAQVAHCLVQRHKTKPPTCSGISGKAVTQWELVQQSKYHTRSSFIQILSPQGVSDQSILNQLQSIRGLFTHFLHTMVHLDEERLLPYWSIIINCPYETWPCSILG